ncbi:hypothetical protein F5Y19DRAFT_2313 [Xylariaceae sp. FL1651]|nr:hypothetical protein F5Y19DRAFT_2313 [Xylariaceae sp. FL1651]
MPHIGFVMERSLQDHSLKDAFVKLLARSAVAALGKRQSLDNISGGIQDAATAFSSWDNCMQAAFCKWPVIALIIIGGLILLSIVWCIVRCCCCGLSCCCECCYCLRCCGQCCGMCDPPRGKRSKYLDEPFVPPNHDQAYRSQAPMQSGFDSMKPSVPQYAEFDSGTKKDADALPAMPSWEDASSKKVLIEEEAVEMEPLKKPDLSQNPSLMSVNNVAHAASPSPISPGNVSPYGPPVGINGPNGYMAAGHEVNPYNSSGQSYNDYNNHGYGQQYPQNNTTNMHQGYNMAGGVAGGPIGRGTPHQDYDNGYDRGNTNQGYSQYPQSRSPRPYNDEYGRSNTPTAYSNSNSNNNNSYRGTPVNDGYGNARGSPGPQAGYGYGNPSRMGTPGAQAGYGLGNARRSPGAQAGYGYPQRSRTEDDYRQQYPAAPHRQYSNDSQNAFARPAPEQQLPRPLPPVSPIRNNSGFDFNSGHSRLDSQQTPAPPQTASGGIAYPGYRSYKPAQDTQQQQHNWGGL